MSTTRGRESGMLASDTAGAVDLPVGRAFLVQLAGDCDPTDEVVRGRVEHVRSGEAAHFKTLAELIVFMRGVLVQLREAAS